MVFGLGKSRANEGAGDGESIKDSSTATFVKDVIEASRKTPVLVDFWAPWCGPCKQLTPLLEKVVRARKGKIKLVKVNIDENPAIAGQLRVQSIPTVYAFRDGRPLDGFMGAQPESAINAFVDRLLADEGAEDAAAAIEAAERALLANDLQHAAEIYAGILQDEPQNVAALAGLAQCYLKSGDTARAEQTIGLVPPDRKDAAPVASVRAALELARNAAKAGDATKLEAKVKAAPQDHQARIDYALALAAADKKAEAVEQLLEAVRRDRKWNEEAARKQLVQLFDAWGPKDPATLEGRRRLSSILFS
jgi:putative thioredoxin